MKNMRLFLGLIVAIALIVFLPKGRNSETAPLSSQDKAASESSSGELRSARHFREAWDASTSPAHRERILTQAEKHRETFSRLMKASPDIALLKAIPLHEHAALPLELHPYFEQQFSAFGTTDLYWSIQELADGQRHCSSYNTLTIKETTLKATSSDGQALPVLKNAPFAGIRLGNRAVVSPLSALPLSPADLAVAQSLYPVPESGTSGPFSAEPGPSTTGALLGGTLYHFQSPAQITAINEHLSEALKTAKKEDRQTLRHSLDWLASDIGGDTPGEITDATPYQEDQINALFIRVDFSDFQGEPVSKAALEATLETVKGHIETNSYGKAGLSYTVSDTVYRMPSSGASYAVSDDNDGIQTDARALASANYIIADYDVIAVYFPRLSGVPDSEITYGGLASIGGSNHWINGANSVGIILHEFGHNYGLFHANYHHPEQELGGEYQVAGSLEYGDIFDEMGSGSSPQAQFSHLAKNYLQWLPDSKVTEARSDDTFTIYRFDDPNAVSNLLLAVKVPMSNGVNYWVGYRQLFTSNRYNLETSAYVVAENLAQARETSLIDMTPESKTSESADRDDAGLPVGGTFYEPDAGVRFNALERGGTAPNQWIRIEILFDPRISLAATEVPIDEQCGIATVTVQRRFSGSGAVSVSYSTNDGTATSGDDYFPTSGTLTWADGDLSDKTITIPIRPDLISEGAETLTLNLTDVIGGKLDPGAATASISILDAGQQLQDFAPPFFNTTVDAIVPLSDGKVVIGGTISSGIGNVDSIRHIARLNPDGSVDTSFVTGTGFDSPVETITLQNDGKLLVGGEFTSYDGTTCNRIARLNADGTLDSSFVTANGSGANDLVRAIAVEADGKILVGGDLSTFDGTPVLGLVRLNQNGSRDTANPLNLPFNTSFTTDVYAIVAEESGKITTGGVFYISGAPGGFRSGLARLNSDGTRDPTFEPDAGAHRIGATNNLRTVYDIAQQSDGKYLIAGSFTAYDENSANRLARVENDGSFDASFTPPVFNNTSRTLIAQASGATVVGGSFSSPANFLERVTASGVSDPAFNQGSGPGGPVYDLATDSSGAIWVGGNFFSYNGSSSRPIVKISGGVTPYDLWAQTRFTETDIANGISAPNEDPDDDGLVNLVELAMGTNPKLANSDTTFGLSSDDGITLHRRDGLDYLQISIDRTSLTRGLWFGAQFSSDLIVWTPTNPVPGSHPQFDIIEDSPTRFTVRDKTPITPAAPRFGKISVRPPE